MIRVFPKWSKWIPNDRLAFVGDPPLFRPPSDFPVRISCTFTWDIEECERLKIAWSQYYSDVQVGGPAYDDPGDEFIPGKFLRKGITITSRGCIKKCPWCFVPKREGQLRELKIQPGHIIQDNNLLACSTNHINAVFAMLQKQTHPIILAGGFASELFNQYHAELLYTIRLKEVWFACDHPKAIEPLKNVASIIKNIPNYKKRCYVLIGYNGETLKQAEERLKIIYRLGFYPFAMLYKTEKAINRNTYYSDDWLKLARIWSRPAAFKAFMRNR